MADDKEKEKILVIKSILNLHPRDGADIFKIRREYRELQGEDLEKTEDEATALMWRIPDVKSSNGRFFSHSQKSEHILKLVQEQRQKPRMQRRASCYFDRDRVSDDESHTRNSMNWAASRSRSPVHSRWSDARNRSRSSVRPSASNGLPNYSFFGARNRVASPPPARTNSRPPNDVQPLLSFTSRDPRINNHFDRERGTADETMSRQLSVTQSDIQYQHFAIIADDFLFSLILERTLFAQEAQNFENMLEPRWSYCVVGQTIADAVVLIKAKNLENGTKELPSEPIKVIVNIGAADICRGTNFRQMAEDFMELMETCTKLNMEPTITTIVPFGATEKADEIAWKAHTFNKFLVENFTNVIDMWSCFSIGLSRSLGLKFELNGVAARFSGRESDITWEHDEEKMRLEHRGKV